MRFRPSNLLPFCGVVAFATAAATGLKAQEDAKPQTPAADNPPLTLTAAADRVAESEARVMDLENRLRSIGEGLAASNKEAATVREDYERLRLQLETLGIAALKPEVSTLKERLISALNDLRLTEVEKKALAERLASLSDAALALLSDPNDANGRKRLQDELAAANRGILSASQARQTPPVALDAAKVISLKSDLGLAVINTGRDSGLRSGTPMRIVRADQTVATGLVVDVRNRIAGVLLTSAGSRNQIQVGDSAKPETTQTTLQK
ncbi:MAG: hypothetical protein V4726_21715 [Verrucomicrobiota bacterium]